MDKWKVIKEVSEIPKGGIFQEKQVVICTDPMDYSKLKQLVETHPNGEMAELPERMKSIPFAFAFWINKHDPHINEEDIKAGNLRVKIN